MKQRITVCLLGLAALGTGCGLFPPHDDEIRFNGVIYSAVGSADVTVTAQGLLVENAGAGEYGVRAERPRGVSEADFEALPIALPSDGRWGLEAQRKVNGVLTPLATVWNEALDEETHQIRFDFDPVLGASLVTLEYYLDGQLLYRIPDVPLAGETGTVLLVASGGQSAGEPESVHVVRDGPRIVVGTDYGGDPPGGLKQGDTCDGALVQVSFPDVPAEFCTDYVQAIPQTEVEAPAVVGVEVRAAVLDQFTLTSATLVR